MKFSILLSSVLVLTAAALSQEPINNAVQQPAVYQPAALQPTMNVTSVLQVAPLPPAVPYLSEPVIRSPQQVAPLVRPLPVTNPARQPVLQQPGVCGCSAK